MNYFAAEARFKQGDVEYEKFLKLAIPDKLDFSPAPAGRVAGQGRRRQKKKVEESTRRSSRPGSTNKGKQLDDGAARSTRASSCMKQAHWVIAAAARIGQLYQDFSGQLYTAPVPKAGAAPAGYPQEEFDQYLPRRVLRRDGRQGRAARDQGHRRSRRSASTSRPTCRSTTSGRSCVRRSSTSSSRSSIRSPSEIRAQPGYVQQVAMDRAAGPAAGDQVMNALNSYGLALVFAASAVAGCATTGTPGRQGRRGRGRGGQERERAEAAVGRQDPGGQAAAGAAEGGEGRRSRRSRPAPRPSSTRAVKKWDDGAEAEGRHRRRPTARGWRRTSRASRDPAARGAGALQRRHHPRGLRLRQGRRERVPGGAVGEPGLRAGDGQPRRALLQAEQPGDGEDVVREGHRRRPGATRARPSPTSAPSSTSRASRPATRRSTRRRSRTCAARSPSTPYDIKAYSILALVYYTIAENDKSKLDLAQLVCKQAQDIEVGKDYPPIYNTLGLIQLRKKNPSTALKQFEQAVALDPKYVDAHLNIGAIGLVDAPVREGGAVVRGGAQARAEELRRDHRHGRGVARPQEDRRGGELVQEGGRARPAQLRGPVQPRRPLSGLQVATRPTPT